MVPTRSPIPPRLLAELRAAHTIARWSRYEAALAELASQVPGFVGVDRSAGLALGYRARPEREPSRLVAIAQLHAVDVPDLPSRPDADLLQVLWCPNDHDDGGAAWAPAVTLRWRRQADVPTAPHEPPAPTAASHPRYLPRPCVLHPERVVEYPWWQELPAELGQQVRAWDAAHHGMYHRQLSTAPGWKVGGWPSWPSSDPIPLYCTRCGAALRQLLQIDSSEWGDQLRWRPLQERVLAAGAVAQVASGEPTGVIAGHSGLYRIFYCPHCPDPESTVRVDVH